MIKFNYSLLATSVASSAMIENHAGPVSSYLKDFATGTDLISLLVLLLIDGLYKGFLEARTARFHHFCSTEADEGFLLIPYDQLPDE